MKIHARAILHHSCILALISIFFISIAIAQAPNPSAAALAGMREHLAEIQKSKSPGDSPAVMALRALNPRISGVQFLRTGAGDENAAIVQVEIDSATPGLGEAAMGALSAMANDALFGATTKAIDAHLLINGCDPSLWYEDNWRVLKAHGLAPVPGKTFQNLIDEGLVPGRKSPPAGQTSVAGADVRKPFVRRSSAPIANFPGGLTDLHVSLGPSHGWYYYETGDTYLLQRPRLYTVTEDYLSPSVTNPFLAPMFENAGGGVFVVRERDWQHGEVIVDNDAPMTNGDYTETMMAPGFNPFSAPPNPGWGNTALPKGSNPMTAGTARVMLIEGISVNSDIVPAAHMSWTPQIPGDGYYAVYVTWPAIANGITDATYQVHHAGGIASFTVDQTIGAGTWVYLGRFWFAQGQGSGHVRLLNQTSDADPEFKVVAGDAVKFGGGIGSTLRGPSDKASGRPRFTEGSVYWSQYSGAPDNLVYGLLSNEYDNDIASRGELTNWINGAPSGPNSDRSAGLGVPIEVFIALHSNAGGLSSRNLTSMSVYWRESDQFGSTTFPDGRPRTLNGVYTALMHDQILSDFRGLWSSTWPSVGVLTGNYGEIRRPNVPSVLLEVQVHQNVHNMMYYLDPRFRFDYARSIYKATLRFIAAQRGFTPIIQPLPPTHLQAVSNTQRAVTLRWQPKPDPLEPTATADGYIVYQSPNGWAFDNGTDVGPVTQYTIPDPQAGDVRYFRVAAYNAGGMSFPTETLGVRLAAAGKKPAVLVVSGFDRLSPPEIDDVINDNIGGFRRDIDPGVAWEANIPLSGDQLDFNFGAGSFGNSSGSMESSLEKGNTFNFINRIAPELDELGYAFDAASDEAVADGQIALANYHTVIWMLGREKLVAPHPIPNNPGRSDRMTADFEALDVDMRARLGAFMSQGGNVFLNGAELAWDLAGRADADPAAGLFLNQFLKLAYDADDASDTNQASGEAGTPFATLNTPIDFSSALSHPIYTVGRPDSFQPLAMGERVMSFGDSGRAAAVAATETNYRAVTMGFPVETILDGGQRRDVLDVTLKFLQTPLEQTPADKGGFMLR